MTESRDNRPLRLEVIRRMRIVVYDLEKKNHDSMYTLTYADMVKKIKGKIDSIVASEDNIGG